MVVRSKCEELHFKTTALQQSVFKGMKFKISREVPREQLELLLISGGAEVLTSTVDDHDDISHIVTDRVVTEKLPGKEYI